MSQKQASTSPSRADIIKCTIYMVLYFAFLYWVGSWWGLIATPLIFDLYITKKINWGWWKELENPLYRMAMSWVDAIVFALIAIYFLNNFFFQNFVIPTSSLEKTMLVGDYLCVSKVHYGPRIPQTPLTMPLTQNTMPAILGGGKSYLDHPHWDYRRVQGLDTIQRSVQFPRRRHCVSQSAKPRLSYPLLHVRTTNPRAVGQHLCAHTLDELRTAAARL